MAYNIGYHIGIIIGLWFVFFFYASIVLAWKRANEHPTVFTKIWKVTMIILGIFCVIGLLNNIVKGF